MVVGRARPARAVAGGRLYAGFVMVDLVDRIRKELDVRIEQLHPLVDEFERLQRAAAALARSGVRAVPGVGARGPAATKPARKPAGRAARPKPAAGRRVAARPGTPAAGAATSKREPAQRSSTAEPAVRKAAVRRRGTAAGRSPAPRGQTQAKVLAALRAAPGSTTAAVATAAGIPTKTASATVSRLVKQGRVRRLDEGGYAPVEAHSGAAQAQAAAVTAEVDLAASDTRGAQAPAPTDAPTPE